MKLEASDGFVPTLDFGEFWERVGDVEVELEGVERFGNGEEVFGDMNDDDPFWNPKEEDKIELPF